MRGSIKESPVENILKKMSQTRDGMGVRVLPVSPLVPPPPQGDWPGAKPAGGGAQD